MKILIVTSFTKNITWGGYGDCDFGKLSSTNHLKYANKHNYSYLCDIIDEENYEKHLTWVKIDVVREQLFNYDYVVWIDSDAVFVNMDIKIEDFLINDPNLIITKSDVDRRMGIIHTHTSTGFMIWKNSEWSINLLDEMLEYDGRFIHDYFHEQSLLDEKLIKYYEENSNILNKEITDLENPILLNDGILIIPYKYHRCYTDVEINYIYHAGGETPTKYERIKEVLNQKNACN